MIGVIIFFSIVIVIGYILLGRWMSTSMLPQFIATSRKKYSFDEIVEEDVKTKYLMGWIFWPGLAAYRLWGLRPFQSMESLIEKHDPEIAAKKLAERDLRIAALERELNIR